MGMAADNLECYENLANAIICRLLRITKPYCSVWRIIQTIGMRNLRKRAGRFLSLQLVQYADGSGCCTLISGVQARVKVEAVERRRRRAENLRRKAEREMKKLVKLLTEAGAALTPENIRALGDIA